LTRPAQRNGVRTRERAPEFHSSLS
jgi:hypothetical protein